MGDLIQFIAPLPKDGGKARTKARRERLGLAAPRAEDLTMDHADPEADTRPSELA